MIFATTSEIKIVSLFWTSLWHLSNNSLEVHALDISGCEVHTKLGTSRRSGKIRCFQSPANNKTVNNIQRDSQNRERERSLTAVPIQGLWRLSGIVPGEAVKPWARGFVNHADRSKCVVALHRSASKKRNSRSIWESHRIEVGTVSILDLMLDLQICRSRWANKIYLWQQLTTRVI